MKESNRERERERNIEENEKERRYQLCSRDAVDDDENFFNETCYLLFWRERTDRAKFKKNIFCSFDISTFV